MEKELHPLGKALFNLQRFQILQAKRNEATAHTIPDYYAYAWYAKVYPFFDEVELNEDLKDYFHITEKEVDIITKYAADEWDAGRLHNFYEYESHFGVRQGGNDGITRGKLISVFRYCYLSDHYDEAFWKKLIEPMKHPTEAATIISDFNPDQLYII